MIDANTVLAFSVTLQCLKLVVGRYAQVIKPSCTVQHLQFALGYRSNVGESRNACTAKQGLCISAFETLNHGCNCITRYVKRQEIMKSDFLKVADLSGPPLRTNSQPLWPKWWPCLMCVSA